MIIIEDEVKNKTHNDMKVIFGFLDKFHMDLDCLLEDMYPLIEKKYNSRIREYYGSELKNIKKNFESMNCMKIYKNLFSCQQTIICNESLKFTKNKCLKVLSFIKDKLSDASFNISEFLDNMDVSIFINC